MDQNPKITPDWIRGAKARGERIAALTAYDYPTARLLDEAGVPFILVGDSLGMVVLGYPDTTHVTLADIRHHVAAVARRKPGRSSLAIFPITPIRRHKMRVANAKILIEAGAEALKLEGGVEVVPEIRAMRESGIAVVGHIGMLPQRVKEEGGYKIKGRSESEKERLFADALAVEEAGVFAVVLELVEPELARAITDKLSIPTIGIGSGAHCYGNILVTHDLVGAFPVVPAQVCRWPRPMWHQQFAVRRRDLCATLKKRGNSRKRTQRSQKRVLPSVISVFGFFAFFRG